MAQRAYNLTVFGLFLAILLLPAAMFAMRMRAREFEGGPMAQPPRITMSRLLDPKFYDDLNAWLRDSNPVRESLVKAVAKVRYDLNDIANDQVLAGRDGWLFLHETVVRGCRDESSIRAQVANLKKFSETLRGANIQFLFAIAPDKPSIYPDKLTPLMVRAGSCWNQSRAAITRTLEDQGVVHWNGWKNLSAAKGPTEA